MRATRMPASRTTADETGRLEDMAGRKAYDRDSYLADIRTLRRRGWTWRRIADELGLSLSTLHRIARGE